MRKWEGTPAFLNSRAAQWIAPDGQASLVTWKFTRYKGSLLPFFVYSCHLNAWGLNSIGSGRAATPDDAARKAFAEAWERLWMKTISDGLSVFPQPEFDRFKLCSSSNGFAAGATAEMAAANSRTELIERAIFLQAWQSMSGWKRIAIRGIRSKVLALAMAAKGWKTYLFEIESNCGLAMACLLLNPNLGATFDIALGTNPRETEIALLNSVVTSTFTITKDPGRNPLPLSGAPEDHFLFYTNPQNLEAFDFLTKPVRVGNTSFKEVLPTDLKTSAIQLPEPGRILTQEIVSAGTFPAVARSYNPEWQQLSWGKMSIKGTNLWPHPLA